MLVRDAQQHKEGEGCDEGDHHRPWIDSTAAQDGGVTDGAEAERQNHGDIHEQREALFLVNVPAVVFHLSHLL